jgi:hypothetical protein
MWLNRTRIPIILGEKMGQRQHQELQKKKLILLAGSSGCKTWTRVVLYRQRLSSFFAMAVDDFEMLVSCARRLSDFFRNVYSNLASISSSFSSVRTRHLLAGFLSRSDPWTWLSKKLMDTCLKCFRWKFTTKFSPTLYTGTTFHKSLVQKNTLLNGAISTNSTTTST